MEVSFKDLTIENAATAIRPAGMGYGQRVDWTAKRDYLVREAARQVAAPVNAATPPAAVELDPATLELVQAEAANGCPEARAQLANITRARVAQVVAEARAAAGESPRWLAAINRAYQELEIGNWSYSNGRLIIASRTRKRRYHPTATTCQCEAHQKGQPCFHRAALRLVERAARPAA